MHAEFDQGSADVESKDAPIYLPPAGDNLDAWRDLPYKRESWTAVLTYWVNELRWRKLFWGKYRG